MLRLARVGLGSCMLALLFLTGCGGEPGTWVTGSVTYEGKPADRAAITFRPLEMSGRPAACSVADGRFTVRIIPGKYKIKVETMTTTETAPVYSYENYKAHAINPAEMEKARKASRAEQSKFAAKVEGVQNEAIPDNARGNDAEMVVDPRQDLTINLFKPKQ